MGVILIVSLNRVLILMLDSKIHKIEMHGETAFVIDNKMMEDIDWSMHKVVMINPLMILGECVPHYKWKRLNAMRFV